MDKLSVFFVLLISLGIVCVFTISSSAQEQTEQAEIEKTIDDACVDSQKGAIFNYTYQLKASYEKKKKLGFGRKFTKIYEAVIPSRFTLTEIYTHPLVLIQDSENPISQSEIDKARRDLVLEMERAEKFADKPAEKQKEPDGGYWTMKLKADQQRAKVDIYKIVKIAKFSNMQRKQINGREVITMDFSPQAVIIYDNSLSYMSKIEGQIWIDPLTKRIIRVEGFPKQTFNAIKDKSDSEREDQAVLLFVQTKVAEGFWFPQTVRLDFTKNPEIFEAIKLEFSFSGYKKATVDIQDTKINEPKNPKDKDAETDADAVQNGKPKQDDRTKLPVKNQVPI